MGVYLLSLVLFVICLNNSNSLNLQKFGLGDYFYLSSIAVFRNKAFLALPRNSCFNNVSSPTLIQVNWNGERQLLNAGKKIFYPNDKSQMWGKCEDLQNVVSLDVDLNGFLWILDKGSDKCLPKVVVYNLYKNVKVCLKELKLEEDLSDLVVDRRRNGAVAYIGNKSNNLIVVFSLENLYWWFVKINNLFTTIPERIVLSRTEDVLFITQDNSSELYAMAPNQIRELEKGSFQNLGSQEINATFIGHKLGPSAGLVSDVAGGLNYYLTRDYAVVRWDTSKPLQAEHHDVILQSYEALPYISQLFTDPFNSIWALINPSQFQECTYDSKLSFQVPKDIPLLKTRIMRISKFINRGKRKNCLIVG